ncbi:MAG: AraC family transcriptional regulator [Myxococcota bacterium]
MRTKTSEPAAPPAARTWIRLYPRGPDGPRIDRLETHAFMVGRFRCPPTAPQWGHANMVGSYPLVVIPHHAVEILRAKIEPVLASPARCVFYNAHQEYERRLVDPRGDDCTYFALQPELLADVVATELDTSSVDPSAPFEVEGGTLGTDCYAQYQSILRTLASDPCDPAAMLEPILGLMGAIVRTSRSRSKPKAASSRRGTTARHRTLVHETERLLGERFDEPLGLAQIAATVGASPYHLARIFRATTGHTIHEHRTQIRINVAIQRLADPHIPLTDLALDLGYSSHSHFSDQFRRSVGIPPSMLRAALDSRSLRRSPSTILKAVHPARCVASRA